jgi:hypothetical protein
MWHTVPAAYAYAEPAGRYCICRTGAGAALMSDDRRYATRIITHHTSPCLSSKTSYVLLLHPLY